MKVLFLPKYGKKAASCRYRFLQYLPYLEAHGVHCTVSPLFDDHYLEHKFSTGRSGLSDVVSAFARRALAVLSSRKFDLVVLHLEAFPYLPPFFEDALKMLGVRYIYDYDDAIFHNYDLHRRFLVRLLLGNKIPSAIAGAKTVIAGNRYLAQYAKRVNYSVNILPTVVDVEKYQPAPDAPEKKTFTVGWIGSPSTSVYLSEVAGALRELCSEGKCKVRLVGAAPVSLPGVDFEVVPWSESREIAEVQGFDVGIMPSPDEAWARGKCGFKLIQYMACAVPAIASPVGINREIVDHGDNGFLATSKYEWVQALRALRDDSAFRRRLGEAGRRKVEQKYSLQVAAPQLLDILERAAKGPEWAAGETAAAAMRRKADCRRRPGGC